jgi:ribosomal protein S18 acetylase RimI-like enzyme
MLPNQLQGATAPRRTDGESGYTQSTLVLSANTREQIMYAVRQLSAKDLRDKGCLRGIALLEVLAWGNPVTRQSIEANQVRLRQQLDGSESEHHAVFAATKGDTAVGICRAMQDAREHGVWLIYGLAVHPHHRRQGIAQSLYRSIAHYLRLQGATAIYAATHVDNHASRAFHEAMGYGQGCPFTAPDGDCLIRYTVPIKDPTKGTAA